MSTKNFYTTVAVVVVTILFTFMVFCLVTKIVDKAKEPAKPESEQVIEEAIDQSPIVREVRFPNTDKWMYRISKVEFEGHTYIVLEDTGSAILHDPDCQCQTQK